MIKTKGLARSSDKVKVTKGSEGISYEEEKAEEHVSCPWLVERVCGKGCTLIQLTERNPGDRTRINEGTDIQGGEFQYRKVSKQLELYLALPNGTASIRCFFSLLRGHSY